MTKKHNGKPQEPITQEPTTPEPAAQEQPKPEPTVQELMAQLQSALDKGDYKLVASVSRQIDQRERAKEKAELEAKRAELEARSESVKQKLLAVVQPMIDSGILDKADGIWFSYDFGDKAATVRLMKTAARAPRTGGGGTGKKFDISTEDMLAKHGGEVYKDGQTFRAAYDQNTDKNWRYAIRQKLLKLEGII